MMASSQSKLDSKIAKSIHDLLWGPNVKDEVFCRWTQGFCLSQDEPTALVQHEGGPCALIAPVQAYLLREALFSAKSKEDISSFTVEESKDLLLEALVQLLSQVATTKYYLMSLDSSKESTSQNSTNNKNENEEQECQCTSDDTGQTRAKRPRLDEERFHSRLRCVECENEETLRTTMKSHLTQMMDNFGVLLYLYSLVLSKGIEQIKNELEDPGDPLIDCIHGHGSQSLINLFLCGKAVSNVWDNEKDVSGLKLQGIHKQTDIGFLTLMEHMRYCEVGWYFKNPCYPIWLLGSETHLTVLFSKEKSLVIQENSKSSAQRIFQSFDPEGNGFISTGMLGDLLGALDLVSEKEYVDIMSTKLDSEKLGIITMCCFMDEFYPEESTPEMPSTFTLYHYNGLPRSQNNNKVKYTKGKASIPEELEVQIITDVSPIRMCLQTKWPTIELEWESENVPSLN